MVLKTKLYHFARSRAHKAMAEMATSEPARRAHTELADRYASKAEDVAYRASMPRTPVVQVEIASDQERRQRADAYASFAGRS